MSGAYDLHFHIGPEVIPRRCDALSTARELEAGGMKYTVMSVEDGPFYTMYIATMLPNDKGMLCATFHGETAKDKNEQKEVFKQILDAVKIK